MGRDDGRHRPRWRHGHRVRAFLLPGPAYTERRIYRAGRSTIRPRSRARHGELHDDFTGDGWPDILSSARAVATSICSSTPRAESRRWDKFRVLPTISTELVLMRDLDTDGKPEMIFGGGAAYNWARPDPANPTAAWGSNRSREKGSAYGHGIGVGDMNNDGRVDIVVPTGWDEQPARGSAQPWTFHEATFGDGGGAARWRVRRERRQAHRCRQPLGPRLGSRLVRAETNAGGSDDLVCGAHNRRQITPRRTPEASCSPRPMPRGSPI